MQKNNAAKLTLSGIHVFHTDYSAKSVAIYVDTFTYRNTKMEILACFKCSKNYKLK